MNDSNDKINWKIICRKIKKIVKKFANYFFVSKLEHNWKEIVAYSHVVDIFGPVSHGKTALLAASWNSKSNSSYEPLPMGNAMKEQNNDFLGKGDFTRTDPEGINQYKEKVQIPPGLLPSDLFPYSEKSIEYFVAAHKNDKTRRILFLSRPGEDLVSDNWQEVADKFIDNYSDNILRQWKYAFFEMPSSTIVFAINPFLMDFNYDEERKIPWRGFLGMCTYFCDKGLSLDYATIAVLHILFNEFDNKDYIYKGVIRLLKDCQEKIDGDKLTEIRPEQIKKYMKDLLDENREAIKGALDKLGRQCSHRQSRGFFMLSTSHQKSEINILY